MRDGRADPLSIIFAGRSRFLESERCAIRHYWYSGHFRNSGFSPVGWFRGYEYWHFYLCEWWWALTSEVSSNLLKPLNWALFLRYHDFGCLFSGIRQNQNSYGVAQHTVAEYDDKCVVRGGFQSTNAGNFIDEFRQTCPKCGTAEPIPWV